MLSFLLTLGEVVVTRFSWMSSSDIFDILLNEFKLSFVLLQTVLDLFGEVCAECVVEGLLGLVVDVVRLEGRKTLDKEECFLDGGLEGVYTSQELLMLWK